ncbi:MAG: hypothetical protein ACJ72J_18885 [Nitrososphaeraceae archaeon]
MKGHKDQASKNKYILAIDDDSDIVTLIEQALGCEELWSMNNGVSICYRCHKDVEKLGKIKEYVLAKCIYINKFL